MKLFGHQEECRLLLERIEKGTFPQSVLFSGPEGVGKARAALLLASSLVGEPDFEPTDAYPHPVDVLVVRPERETARGRTRLKPIPVEAAREILHFLSHTPTGGRRVAILEDAHTLSVSAQNALLKGMEEPLPYAHTIFVTHEKGRLLDTLRSRLEEVFFRLVPEAVLRDAFPPDTAPDFFFALGRPGLLERAQTDPAGFEKDKADLASLFRLSALSRVERLSLAEALSADAPRALRLLEWYLPALEAKMRSAGEPRRIQAFARFLERSLEVRGALGRGEGQPRLLLESLFLSV
jgi:DNA polymerase-3 subunit delta'